MTNLLIITADDLSYYSLCVNYPRLWPTLDQLTQKGVSFSHAHTNIGLCEPARCVLMTGKYPQNNGATGFCPLRPGTLTLPAYLKKHGYYTGIFGKVSHHRPPELFPWDFVVAAASWDLLTGKPDRTLNKQDINQYKIHAADFIKSVGNRPYFLLINSHDPHRPFLPPDPNLNLDAITVPSFLPDTWQTRHDLASYFTSIARLDKNVQAILEIVDLSNTIIVFTSDHGMSFPFVKANCYNFSTNIPLTFVWNGTLKPHKDDEHMVASVDLMSTLLELLGLPQPEQDGKSYAPILFGGKQQRDEIYTQLNSFADQRIYQMRCLLTKKYCFIKNIDTEYPASSVDSWGFEEALKTLPPERLKSFQTRPKEEFYDIVKDPFATVNLTCHPQLAPMRYRLSEIMETYKDPLIKLINRVPLL